jgi:hypothetical protein
LEEPKVNALPLIKSSTTLMDVKPMYAKPTTTKSDGRQRGEAKAEKEFRFVRVNERLFKVRQSNISVSDE